MMTKSLQEITNEESRVDIYFGSGKPTDPSTVTTETKLSELNLNWREKDLPERVRTKHVHRFVIGHVKISINGHEN